jgi:chorismate synthase
MAGNSFGEIFKITTFGESHGKAIGVVIDGVKPNIPISIEEIQKELDRRRPGQSNISTPRKETDQVEILSGIFQGKSTGAPICMVIWNKDQDSKVYERYKDVFRPGHAGYTYLKKYGIFDYYGGGRASGRETAARVAAGAVAKTILKSAGIEIIGYTKQIGKIKIKEINFDEIEKNPVRCPDKEIAVQMELLINKIRESGDSVGGVVEVIIQNCPVGLGDPVFDKLHAEIGKALLSIGAVKGFEIGDGFKAAESLGSKFNDLFYYSDEVKKVRTRTNHGGGILGGISNGEDIICRIAVKPTSSIRLKQETLDFSMRKRTIEIEGRHDPCICPRIVPVAEAMCSLVILDRIMIQDMIKENTEIDDIRKSIDLLDKNLMMLLSLRNERSRKIGELKRKLGLPILDKKREGEILFDRKTIGNKLDLDPKFLEQIFNLIFIESKKLQK